MAYSNINKPDDYFNTKLYAGNSATNNITVGFQPDFVWIKNRTDAFAHYLTDSVRGVNKILFSNTTGAEYDGTAGNAGVSAFTSTGFTLLNGSFIENYNATSNNYVSWNWLAGGTGVSNTQGSITSTVSANTTSGFSIVSYTGNGSAGATIGHGLGVAPAMIILKSRTSGVESWHVYHQAYGTGTQYFLLNSTDAVLTASVVWNNTAPDVDKFTVGTAGGVNGSGATFIAYCFAEKKGFSKFSSYTGNGSSDGTFVYTGFKPAWLLVKKSSASGTDWNLHNNKSPGFNVNDNYLAPNEPAAEVTNNSYQIFDFCSNGFKCRGTGTGTNASGETYIYMAFAENPLVAGNYVPTTAR